jgi:hypothetical protein
MLGSVRLDLIHSNIRAPTAALEADALASLLFGRPRD